MSTPFVNKSGLVVPTVSHHVLDVPAYAGRNQPPATIIDRTPPDRWLICAGPLGPGGCDWDFCVEGQYVRIPLFPYRTHTDPELAMAFAFQLGLQAMYTVDTGSTVRHIHIAVGHPVQDKDDHLKFWLGFALLLADRARMR